MRTGFVALLVSALVGSVALPATAQQLYAGNTIAYQGKLELAGEPVTQQVDLTFRFYSSVASTSELDAFSTTVTPADGSFSVELGPLADEVFAADELFVAIEVDGALLGGRQRVIAAPRAARADTAKELTVTGTAVVLGNTVSNNLEIGNMGHSGWAGVAHTDAAVHDRYALLQNGSGSETLVNAASGGRVGIRIGNVDRVSVDANGNLDVAGETQLGYRRTSCAYPSGATSGDCSCAAGERVLSGGSYVNTQENQPGHLEGFFNHRKAYWLRESRPLDDDTWRVACMEMQYQYAPGTDPDSVVYLEARPTNCGPIDIICARVGK